MNSSKHSISIRSPESFIAERCRTRIRTPRRPDADALRAAWRTRHLPKLLEHCAHHVRRQAGDEAHLVTRHVHLRFSAPLDELDAELPRWGRELAEAMLDRATRVTSTSLGLSARQADTLLFCSPAQRRALALRAQVAGESPWWAPKEPELLERWPVGEADEVAALVEELMEAGALGAVMAATPERALRRLPESLPAARWPQELVVGWGRQRRRRFAEGSMEPMSQGQGRAGASSEDRRASAEDQPSQTLTPPHAGPLAGAPSPEAPSLDGPPSANAAVPTGVTAPSLAAESSHASPSARPPSAPSTQPDARPSHTTQTAPAPPSAPELGLSLGASTLPTLHAPLFYLVGRLLELDLPETLWAAGLPEGEVLTLVAALLLGLDPIQTPDDPAPAAFGGLTPGAWPASPTPEPWAVEEVQAKTLDALHVELARRGVSTAQLPEQLAEAQAWYAERCPPEASDECAQLLSRCAAALALCFRLRLGLDAHPPTLAPWLSQRGWLHFAPERLLVELPMEAVDLELRKAGLDFDPGWMPLYASQVRFVFVESE